MVVHTISTVISDSTNKITRNYIVDDNSYAEILPESFKSNKIWKKKILPSSSSNYNVIVKHSPKTVYEAIEGINVFGQLNELEYSANFQSILLPNDDDNNATNYNNLRYSIIRYYFKASHDLYVCKNDDADDRQQETIITNNYLPNAIKINANSILRIDYNKYTRSLLQITAKLKFFKDKFCLGNTKTTYTGAVEVPIPELKNHLSKDCGILVSSECYSRKRTIIYWYLQLKHRATIYCMRVAFRYETDVTNTPIQYYECNVECEDPISGAHFIECFDLIYKYYKTMAHQYNAIQPMYPDLQEPLDLTTTQRQTLQTFEIIPEPNHQLSSSSSFQSLYSSLPPLSPPPQLEPQYPDGSTWCKLKEFISSQPSSSSSSSSTLQRQQQQQSEEKQNGEALQPLPQTAELVKFLSVLSYNNFITPCLDPKCIFNFKHSKMTNQNYDTVDFHNIADTFTF